MAEAKKYDKVIERVVTSTEPRISLDLSLEEAQTLNALLRRVGGKQEGSRGVLTNGILPALSAVIGDWTWEGDNWSRIHVTIPDAAKPIKHRY